MFRYRNSSSDTSDLDPEDDGLDDPVMSTEEEHVAVYDTNDDGKKVENPAKPEVLRHKQY